MTHPTDQSSREQELSPCPFCGSSDLDPAKQAKQYVACNNCGAFGPSPDSSYPLMQWELRQAEIHDAWNSRAATLPPTAITAEEAGREGEAKDGALANNCGDFAKLTEEVARDAMRYRCIRNVKGPFEVSMHGAMFWNEGLDAVADAAMLHPAPAQSGGQGNG